MFEKIKKYYRAGLYKIFHLEKLLNAGAITREEYEEIIASGDKS